MLDGRKTGWKVKVRVCLSRQVYGGGEGLDQLVGKHWC